MYKRFNSEDKIILAIDGLDLNQALEPNGLGTGSAVADIDNDGILELLISFF